MSLIFKYFSERVLEHVFTRDDYVGIKCSLPKDYNDPFELFLGVDLEQGSELLATYSEVVHEIPPLFTTCFSRSPVVSPMWAHYANDHKGFVLGFEIANLQNIFPEILVRDMSYRDRPSERLVDFARMAAERKKPRDAQALRDIVLYEGYFSKYAEWGYEQEVRAVNLENYLEDVNGNKVLYLPAECIAAIVCGAKSSEQTRKELEELAAELDAEFYVEKIGRSYPTPFLLHDNVQPRVFTGGTIASPPGQCVECEEPLRTAGHLCPWCSIDEADRINAASNNPFRILDHYGLLEQYVQNYPRRRPKPFE
ncbi:DUF2971 domain-containing protein [Sinorhizobium medicae]|nr:DUF2971 domain-containing protein [Sinorhizobium medicae]MDX0578236.1 DUF2971 domain-containing protein [Sinorhizobium medicae]MDX0780052.1 DUF2971 domain-containing protein [Sinorhizobium medicae]